MLAVVRIETRVDHIRILLLTAALASTSTACSGRKAARKPVAAPVQAPVIVSATSDDPRFPLHGIVTGLQPVIHATAAAEAPIIGWVRIGEHVRLGRDATRAKGCASGFRAIQPEGFVCVGEGITVSETAPDSATMVAANRAAGLPYSYWFAKDSLVPEFHQLPSRDQQRLAQTYVEAYEAAFAKDPAKASLMLRPGPPAPNAPRDAPTFPAAVRRFLQRGFFVAGAGLETRSSRRFVRTVRTRFIKEMQLEPRTGTSFRGVELNDTTTLPIAWVVRGGAPMSAVTLPDGTRRFRDDTTVPALERLSTVVWAARERAEGKVLHRLADGHYVRDWYLAVAEKVARPPEVRNDEPWIHVDVGEQSLVAYVGDRPVYATLVSSGLEGHESPRGLFTIREKHVSDTMSDIGADAADQRYSIEDVPWTQYFSGSVALHGAFWHERFGLKRSHGCINLTPNDARWLFEHTRPSVPDGWHGRMATRAVSHVLVTD